MADSQLMPTSPKFQDLTGCRFGRLVVKSFHEISKNWHHRWMCDCDCGSRKDVSGSNLRSGHAISCRACFSQPKSEAHDTFLRNYILLHVRVREGCWEWTGVRNHDGRRYGRLVIRGREIGSHVLSYSLFIGDVPDGMHVLHECDNRSCCNPFHLFLGTNQDNIDDKCRKGRQPKRESHPNSKLNSDQVEEIRRMCAAGETQRAIGAMFGVSYPAVGLIVRGVNWKK